MEDAPPSPAAELRAVSKRFGEAAVAVRELFLAAREGEFLTLLGPSGCGKTTCLRLLSGLEQPDAGAVFLAGRDVTSLPPHRREVNQVFQNYALFPHLSVFDNVAFGLRMKRLPAAEIRARAAAAVELVALEGLTARRPAQLSGGQRQRVALARALVCEPKVLLLDEPLSALDARLRAQVREELRRLQRRLGLTFILVTHDQEEALTLSDRVAVLNAGRVEQIGPPGDIYHRPGSRFVAGFVGEANLLEAELAGQEGGLSIYSLKESGLQLCASAKSGIPGGEKITLLIRPERVQAQSEAHPPGERNAFAARVEERTFQGAAVSLSLRLLVPGGAGEGPLLRALCFDAQAADSPMGRTLHLRVVPEDVIPLPW